jgi:signal recognition particle receptor subunit beta
MPHIDYENKEIAFKVVYFGPGMSGKTTNLVYIHQALSKRQKGKLLTLDTAQERTLFFDFFPLDMGEIAGYKIKFNIYTVPGQVFYEASRRLILEGADGVVFVADSQPDRLDDNIVSYRMMEENLRYYSLDPRTFPLVLQYNKRDCDDPLSLGTLEQKLRLPEMPVLEAVAPKGDGVMKTIRAVCRLAVQRFQL